MVEAIENVVVGGGPAGLRLAQILAGAGRETVVLEKNAEVGPKICAGGLTVKAVRELQALGLPLDAGVPLVAHADFRQGPLVPLDPQRALVRTLARAELGRFQAAWARAAGAEIRTGAAVSRIDLAARTLDAGCHTIRYRRLIGADGSCSAVRRALGLPSPRVFYAAEFNVRGVRLEHLRVAYDSKALGGGYFWVFPHEEYTSIGAGVHKGLVPPATVRPYLERQLAALNVDAGDTPYEGATIETAFTGFDFPGDVHLVGDAAGAASGLTGEGIYAALVSGEETALRILEPAFPRPKTTAWLRMKRLHDTIGRALLRRPVRELSFALIPPLCRAPTTRRWLSALFIER